MERRRQQHRCTAAFVLVNQGQWEPLEGGNTAYLCPPDLWSTGSGEVHPVDDAHAEREEPRGDDPVVVGPERLARIAVRKEPNGDGGRRQNGEHAGHDEDVNGVGLHINGRFSTAMLTEVVFS